MAIGFIGHIKAFITEPGKAFEREQKTPVSEALIYGLKGFLILAIMLSITSIFNPIGALGWTIPFILILIFVGGFVGILVNALWYHLWAYVFGARQGYKETIKILFFAETPVYILGWIPFVNIIAGIWSLVLVGIGLKKLQKLSTGRAVAAIAIAVLIPLTIAILLIGWAIATFGQ